MKRIRDKIYDKVQNQIRRKSTYTDQTHGLILLKISSHVWNTVYSQIYDDVYAPVFIKIKEELHGKD